MGLRGTGEPSYAIITEQCASVVILSRIFVGIKTHPQTALRSAGERHCLRPGPVVPGAEVGVQAQGAVGRSLEPGSPRVGWYENLRHATCGGVGLGTPELDV